MAESPPNPWFQGLGKLSAFITNLTFTLLGRRPTQEWRHWLTSSFQGPLPPPVSPKFHFPYLPPCAAQEMGGWKKSRNLAHWPGASAMPGLPGKVICLSLERSHFVVFRGQRFLWKAWYIYLVWAARNASSQEPLHRGYSLTDMNAGRKVSVSRPCSYLY